MTNLKFQKSLTEHTVSNWRGPIPRAGERVIVSKANPNRDDPNPYIELMVGYVANVWWDFDLTAGTATACVMLRD
jgi:hypothetical protein